MINLALVKYLDSDSISWVIISRSVTVEIFHAIDDRIRLIVLRDPAHKICLYPLGDALSSIFK